MLIPHSEKKIFNFNISALSISIVLIFFGIIIVILSINIIGRSGTKHAMQELKLSNSEYKVQREKIREEIKPLNDLITELTQLTGKLVANSKGKNYEMSEAIGGPEELIEFDDDDDIMLEDSEGSAENDNKSLNADFNKKGLKFKIPPEVALLKQSIHNLQLTGEWGSETIELLKKKNKIIRHTPTIWPVKGHIVSNFGRYIDPYTGKPTKNRGMNIGALPGTEILATADGIAHRIYEDPKYGYTLEIKHRWGIKTVYSFLERVTVKREDKIQKGDVVAFVGKSGYSNHFMLHYEIWVGTEPIDPYPFLNKLLD